MNFISCDMLFSAQGLDHSVSFLQIACFNPDINPVLHVYEPISAEQTPLDVELNLPSTYGAPE